MNLRKIVLANVMLFAMGTVMVQAQDNHTCNKGKEAKAQMEQCEKKAGADADCAQARCKDAKAECKNLKDSVETLCRNGHSDAKAESCKLGNAVKKECKQDYNKAKTEGEKIEDSVKATYKKATNKVKAEAKKVKEAGEVLTK